MPEKPAYGRRQRNLFITSLHELRMKDIEPELKISQVGFCFALTRTTYSEFRRI